MRTILLTRGFLERNYCFVNTKTLNNKVHNTCYFVLGDEEVSRFLGFLPADIMLTTYNKAFKGSKRLKLSYYKEPQLYYECTPDYNRDLYVSLSDYLIEHYGKELTQIYFKVEKC